jgi:hypothetical protein
MSEWTLGVHDYSDDWANIVRGSNKTAWAIHTEAVGFDVNDMSGKKYPSGGITNVVRLNNGYGSSGTIPLPQNYSAFAQRCANFVKASSNISYVTCGNEIALEWERPEGQPITLANYVKCYLLCYSAIKSVAPQVKVAPQAPAPWNPQVPDCPDWIEQLPKMLSMVGDSIDWICLHAYTKGYGHETFYNNPMMNPPYQGHKFGWETLWEYMNAIQPAWRHLPVLITETNGDGPWSEDHHGWIQKMYSVINDWNVKPQNQKILCSALFRWAPHDDRWDMSRHGNAVQDFRGAAANGYRHNYTPATPTPDVPVRPVLGPRQARVTAEAGLNLRARADATSDIKAVLGYGEIVEKLTTYGDWMMVKCEDITGFVWAGYMEEL